MEVQEQIDQLRKDVDELEKKRIKGMEILADLVQALADNASPKAKDAIQAIADRWDAEREAEEGQKDE
jgi:vacuolar-type H+-ATPase subunit C/Vma6